MSKKTPFEEFAAKGLTDPTFPPGGEEELGSDDKMSKGLEGVPITEPNQADISRTAKVVLGTFLSSYVRSGRRLDKKNNAYRPSDTLDRAVSPSRGNSLPKPDPNAKQFTKQDEERFISSTGLGVPKSGKPATLGTFFTNNQVEALVDKIGKDEDKSGHKLLRGIQEGPVVPKPGEQSNYYKPADENKYLNYVYKQLKAANLYSPSERSPFLRDPTSTNEQVATQGLFTIQRDLGSFVLPGETGANAGSGKRVKVSDMSAMAMALLAQSVGDFRAGESILTDFNLAGADAYAILNPLEQLGVNGVKVSMLRLKGLSSDGLSDDLKAKINAARGSDDMMGTESRGSILFRGVPPNRDVDNWPKLQASPYNSVSYGQLTSFLEPFGGMVGSVGMMVLAIESILVLLGITAALSSSVPASRPNQSVQPESPWQYDYGVHGTASHSALDALMYDLLRVTRTDYEFSACVPVGIALLLGFPAKTGGVEIFASLSNPASLVDIALNLVLSPAYYANMMRQIVKDVNEVLAAFRDVIGSSPTQGIQALFAAVEKIAKSKPLRFIMIAAGVGDAALKSYHRPLDVGTEQTMLSNESAKSISVTDLVKIDGRTLLPETKIGSIRKHVSRWGGSGKSKNSLSLSTFLASDVTQASVISPGAFRSLKPGRDTVETIEAALEAEYVPFYFHDLRTHEVISLPAFIDSFDETFNINYNSVTGYGRQDPVRVYQSTERTMNFAFKLVAFNESDFDEMWYTVNKLVTMCYPQYSKGRQRSFKQGKKDLKFTQPFSQVPAASPVIRLRFGDVLKSNYSLPGLARLFGSSAPMELIEYQEARRAVIGFYRIKFNDARSDSKKFANQAKNYGKLRDPTKAYKLDGNLVTAGLSAVASAAGVSPNLGSQVKSWTISDKVQIKSATSIGPLSMTAEVQAVGESGTIKIKVDSSDIVFDETRMDSAEIDRVDPAMKKKAALDKKIKAEPGLMHDPAVRADFFKEDKNAIVRSFNSTRGKGMAGVITSLGLNYSNYPWEIVPGKRAPKLIDVTLSFTPIHDLPLGLDYYGQMRSPSHPVGSIAGSFGSVYTDKSEPSVNESHVQKAKKDIQDSGYGDFIKGKTEQQDTALGDKKGPFGI